MNRKRNQALLDKLRDDRNRLMGELAAIDRTIAYLIQSETDPASMPERGSAKTLLLDLLREVKYDGLNAEVAWSMAKKRGMTLKRGTAGSNLSRMKADGVVTYDGDRYRLPEFTRQPPLEVVAGGKGS